MVDQWVVMIHVYMYVPLHVGLGGHLYGVSVVGKVAVGGCGGCEGHLGWCREHCSCYKSYPQWLFNRML